MSSLLRPTTTEVGNIGVGKATIGDSVDAEAQLEPGRAVFQHEGRWWAGGFGVFQVEPMGSIGGIGEEVREA